MYTKIKFLSLVLFVIGFANAQEGIPVYSEIGRAHV